jgi:Ca2+-binding RTX toxin-like protein
MAIFNGTNNAPDTIYGGAEDDTLYGYDYTSASLGDAGDDDFVYGGAGDDNIFGGVGADTLNGGLGSDFCYGGDGNDIIKTEGSTGEPSYITDFAVGGAGDDILLGGVGSQFLSGEEGNDLLDASAGDASSRASLYGGAGDDTIIGSPGSDILFSDPGADTINLGGGDDVAYLYENDGLDTFDGGAGNDSLSVYRPGALVPYNLDFSNSAVKLILADGTSFVNFELVAFYGTDGNDTLIASSGSPVYYHGNELYGGFGSDDLSGSSNAAILYGGNGADRLRGGAGDDSLSGDDGNDTLSGASGNDLLEGGAGDDLFVAGTALDGTDVYHGYYRPDYYSTFAPEEGNKLDYSILGEANGIVVSLVVGAVAAVSVAGGDTDFVSEIENITSGAGNDYIAGGYLTNKIDGGGGSDWLVGNGGADELLGGLGNDYLCIDHEDTLTDAGAGYDVIFIQDLAGTTLNVGAAHAEWIYSWLGDDVLDASSSSVGVFMAGEAGADVLTGSAFDDIVFMDSLDTVDLGAGYDAMYVYLGTGQSVTDTVINAASAHAEWVKGGAGNDTIVNTGSSVGISLSGGDGNDTLTGGLGNDYLYGNAGADTFVVTNNAQLDAALDFESGSDHINVHATGFISFAQIQAASSNAGASTLIDFGGGNQLLLYGFAIGGLNAADFVF